MNNDVEAETNDLYPLHSIEDKPTTTGEDQSVLTSAL
jgi:hypothetical protein